MLFREFVEQKMQFSKNSHVHQLHLDNQCIQRFLSLIFCFFSDKAPGFHVEVLAVNEVLMKEFKDSKDPTCLNRITELTYKLSEEERGEDFESCANCAALLKGKVRIPTNK